MKNTKIIDILPTLFGVIGGIGAIFASSSNSLATIMLYGGGGATLVTAFVSVMRARSARKASKIHAINAGWIALSILYFLWSISPFAHPLEYKF
jgi:cyanate permease